MSRAGEAKTAVSAPDSSRVSAAGSGSTVRRFVLCEWDPASGLPLDPVGVLALDHVEGSGVEGSGVAEGGAAGGSSAGVVEGGRVVWVVAWLPLTYDRAAAWQWRIAAAGDRAPRLVDEWLDDPVRAAHELPPLVDPSGVHEVVEVGEVVEATVDELLAGRWPAAVAESAWGKSAWGR